MMFCGLACGDCKRKTAEGQNSVLSVAYYMGVHSRMLSAVIHLIYTGCVR
jgi:hypothetical protein